MRGRVILVLIQSTLSLISGILVSKMSFLGKVGITLIYREYSILKVWWKVALLFFAIQLIVILVLSMIKHFYNVKTTRLVAVTLFILGLLGVYLTYIDFTETSHKMLNSSFHAGFYLFWVSFFITCAYFMNFRVRNEFENDNDKINLK
ncbi:hypothetical protein KRX57_00050 [Weeksellaceae bacterium TAE3-ERU29]|nr:hypothetical protein [Weeksellaceae bacterium TAE3-ERU29]